MVALIVLPDLLLCPFGLVVNWCGVHSLYNCLQDHGIDLPNQCERSCVCSACVISIVRGEGGVAEANSPELLLLQSRPSSFRLSCQTFIRQFDANIKLSVVIEISN